MRGAMVGLTDEELLDIAEEVHQAGPKASPQACSTSRRAPGIPWRRPLRPYPAKTARA